MIVDQHPCTLLMAKPYMLQHRVEPRANQLHAIVEAVNGQISNQHTA